MKTVQKIIEAHGGIAALKKKYIRIKNGSWMPLVIEYVGMAPAPMRMDEAAKLFRPALISVCHYGKQNGDPMRDPEMVFGVNVIEGRMVAWTPRYWRNDYMGIEQEIFTQKNGKTFYKPKLLRDLRSFAGTWDRNIKAQRYLEAYLKEPSCSTESY